MIAIYVLLIGTLHVGVTRLVTGNLDWNMKLNGCSQWTGESIESQTLT